WMDFEHAYKPIDESFIEGVWWLIRQAHEKKRLYEGKRSMQWCAHCATALAKHECEYETITEPSIFVKFPVQGEKKTYLIIWTTTPWTIPFNLAVMANPDLDYVKARVEDETWILAQPLADSLIRAVAEKKYEILSTFKGSELEGLRYVHPFAGHVRHYEEMQDDSPKLHTIVLSSEYVDTSAGSGLVHCAPGCGPEDYEVGVRNGLPAFNTLDENGYFGDDMSIFSGKRAKTDDTFFIEQLRKEKALIAVTPVEHEYAHCQRCHNPIVYRSTVQWFFAIDDIKEKMIEENDKILWVPRAAYNAFRSWLSNLRDNSITKQRYWGTPVPIWKCPTCERYQVVSSRAELEKLSGAKPANLHRPWIDDVTIPCECGGTKRRIPDILDVWVDAGSVSWNCLDYPARKDQFEALFPADFILEGKDQIRGWFNLLMVASMVGMDRPSFRNVYMHGFIQDAQGRKMSKSEGNYISPREITEKYGVDTMRYYLIGGSQPGYDLNYNFDDMTIKHRNLNVLWNLHKFILDMAETYDLELTQLDYTKIGPEEAYLLSLANTTTKKVTEKMESYQLSDVPDLIEGLYLEASRTYVQLVREKISAGSDEDRDEALGVLVDVMMTTIKLLAPIAPFITESIYQQLRKTFSAKEESIHLFRWPAFDENLIDLKLEEEFGYIKDIISTGLACREQANVGLRWPLSKVIISSADKEIQSTVDRYQDLLCRQLNVKSVSCERVDVPVTIKPNYKNIAKDFAHETTSVAEAITANADDIAKRLGEETITIGKYALRADHLVVETKKMDGHTHAPFRYGIVLLATQMSDELEREGYLRELTRRIQNLRKTAGLQKKDTITLVIATEEKWLETHCQAIADKVGASKVMITGSFRTTGGHQSVEKIKGKTFTLILDKNI
ncbi:MAG: isoleucine--tRNA ligase, partial [Nanoarchaeota archaeon]